MKGFLYKILWFFLILLIVTSAAFGITFMLSYQNTSNVKLDKNIHTLICGDSHTKTALNDSILPNSMNIAHSSEHYFYTYHVLKVLLNGNPQVSNVILGLSYHNLSAFYDAYVFNSDKTQFMYPRYISVLSLNAMTTIFRHNFKGFAGDFKNIYHGVKRHINAKGPGDYSFIGWFYDSDRTNKNDSTVGLAIQEHFYNDRNGYYEISNFQLAYLQKIIALCREKNVRLILLNCPLSNEYLAQVPKEFLGAYNDLKEEYGQYILDHHGFLVPENCWGDGDHLNHSGSVIFSAEMIKRME